MNPAGHESLVSRQAFGSQVCFAAISRIASPRVHRVPDSFLAVDVVACNDFIANLAEQEGSLRVSKPTRRKSPPWTRTPANRCPASASCANDDKEIRLYALESPAATGRLASDAYDLARVRAAPR